jgi:cold shock CspA family protein/ribosome-associated translation inhibitor RaiA
MNVPLTISFRGLAKSAIAEELIRIKTEKLAQAFPLSRCGVSVERTQKHPREGQPFRVRLDMTVPPGHKLSVVREETEGEMHTSLTTEIINAFDAAEQQLKKLKEKMHGEVKRHPQQEVTALVDELHVEEGWGFLATVDSRRIYFHKNSVLHGEFDRLAIGTGVNFFEEQGEKGPQATSVRIIDKRPSI